ncbi:hypothetical protein [Burkholderia seminalis]|uniref:hypothetical protein n=1 Tax=Burkholderia seminalis TaxID=488731 RepID=UPI0015883361|nr:hypothetical protein [Burkholderia seminalis]
MKAASHIRFMNASPDYFVMNVFRQLNEGRADIATGPHSASSPPGLGRVIRAARRVYPGLTR